MDAQIISTRPTPPPFESCLAAVSVSGGAGIAALDVLPEQLRDTCPQLKEILKSAPVLQSLRTYKEQDSEAVRQQASLMQEATLANVCLMGAGVLSGLALAVGAYSAEARYATTVDNITLALGLLTLALGAFGTYFGFLARDQERVSRWRARRGRAEIARLTVFNVISGKAAEAGAAVALYGLAVVVTHLLVHQRDWLDGRASRHRKSSEVTSRLGGIANALAFVGGSGAIIASQVKGGSVSIALAGVIGAAVASYATNRESLRRDRTNADRYEKVQVVLEELAGRTDDIVAQIAGGDPKALVAFTEAVTDQLATEHKQWLEGTAQADALLAKLDTQLKHLAEARRE